MTSLRSKLWLGFGGLLLILLAVSALSVAVLTRYSHTLEQIFHENYNSVVFCEAMKDALDQLNLRAQQLIWQGSTPSTIDPAAQSTRFADNLDHQLHNCTLPGELDRTQQIAQLWQQYLPKYQSIQNAQLDARAELYRSDLLPQHESMRQAAQAIVDMNMSNMVSVDGKVKQTLVQIRDVMLVLAGAGTLLAAIVIWTAGGAILNPLRALTKSARQIEGGNLDLNLSVRTHDEIGQLAEAFNSMASRLREFRKIDHDRLIRTQQTTQLAIDSLPDGVFIIGPDAKIDISNRTARDHFGIEPGLTVESLDLKWLTPLYQSAKNGNKPVESHGYRSAIQVFERGEERYLLPHAVPMHDPSQTPIGVAVILVDVTRLRRIDEAKSGLVSTVSHELRTPLTSIRMAQGLLAGEKFGALSDDQRKLLDAAREDSDRLYRIIENLLNISRIEAGRAQFQFHRLKPADIVTQAVDSIRRAFAEKNLKLEIDVAPDLPTILADSAAIGSALTNLLSNALKYSPAGGTVRVSVHADENFVAFEVADTGPGIPPEYRARVFEKFFRIPTPSASAGAGLGLSIAKEIIEAHGGTIGVRCPEGKPGSIFRFTLPR